MVQIINDEHFYIATLSQLACQPGAMFLLGEVFKIRDIQIDWQYEAASTAFPTPDCHFRGFESAVQRAIPHGVMLPYPVGLATQ